MVGGKGMDRSADGGQVDRWKVDEWKRRRKEGKAGGGRVPGQGRQSPPVPGRAPGSVAQREPDLRKGGIGVKMEERGLQAG